MEAEVMVVEQVETQVKQVLVRHGLHHTASSRAKRRPGPYHRQCARNFERNPIGGSAVMFILHTGAGLYRLSAYRLVVLSLGQRHARLAAHAHLPTYLPCAARCRAVGRPETTTPSTGLACLSPTTDQDTTDLSLTSRSA